VPSRLGGETGLLNDVKIYAALPDELQVKLENRACVAASYALSDIVARYGVALERVEEFCRAVNLPIEAIDGQRYVSICKPSVIEHPLTHEKALQINYSSVPGLSEPLLRAFWPDYAGVPWSVHRAAWKYPWLVSWSTRRILRAFTSAARQGRGSHPR